jgi:hypothetical protein
MYFSFVGQGIGFFAFYVENQTSGNKIETHEALFEFKNSPPCDKIVTVRQGELMTTFSLTKRIIITWHALHCEQPNWKA